MYFFSMNLTSHFLKLLYFNGKAIEVAEEKELLKLHGTSQSPMKMPDT